jgi:hypothetical protein
VHPGAAIDAKALVRDAAILLGSSGALAIAAGVIKTPMRMPGHSAVFWLPILVLAAAHRRPSMAAGTALIGGGAAAAWGGLSGLEFAGLLGAGAVATAIGLARRETYAGPVMLAVGVLAHAAKLGVKVLAVAASGLPLNRAGLPVLPTLALYVTFGLIGGVTAWGCLAGWRRLRGDRDDRTSGGSAST